MAAPTHVHDADCQIYHVGAYPLYWCKTQLAELVTAYPVPITDVDVTTFGQFVGHGERTPGTVQLFDYAWRIDKEYAATVDLTRPLSIVFGKADGYSATDVWLIDGYHRVYRALSEGRTMLPVAMLDRAVYEQAVLSYDEWVELRTRCIRILPGTQPAGKDD